MIEVIIRKGEAITEIVMSLAAPPQQPVLTRLKVFTRSSVPAEYACTVSCAELAPVCIVFYTRLAARTANTSKLATCERACQAVCSLACCFAKWVLGRAASKVADSLLQLERIGLVGGRDLVDLVFGHVRKLVLAHSLQGRALELALQLRRDTEKEDCKTDDSDDAGKGSEEG